MAVLVVLNKYKTLSFQEQFYNYSSPNFFVQFQNPYRFLVQLKHKSNDDNGDSETLTYF